MPPHFFSFLFLEHSQFMASRRILPVPCPHPHHIILFQSARSPHGRLRCPDHRSSCCRSTVHFIPNRPLRVCRDHTATTKQTRPSRGTRQYMTITTMPAQAVRNTTTIICRTTTCCMLPTDDDDHCPPTYLVPDTTLRSPHTNYPIPRPHRRESPLSSNHIRRLSIVSSATAPAHVICRRHTFVPKSRVIRSWFGLITAPHSRTCPSPPLFQPP